MTQRDRILGGLIGVAVGDALGVPVEFRPRSVLDADLVTGYRAFGTHNQPAGTWSDDTSLTLCLADALCEGVDYRRIAAKFVAWYNEALWTAHGEVFDIGITTRQAIETLKSTSVPELAGPMEESANGNGSLMRILPLAYYSAALPADERRRLAFDISGMTHGHPRAKIACWLYCEIARHLLLGEGKSAAVELAWQTVDAWQASFGGNSEWQHFARCRASLADVQRTAIRSTGYVIDTLEAAIWCLLRGSNFRETVLMAVNLGNDTDTVAAVTGGLAGTFYGLGGAPPELVHGLARVNDLMDLAERFVACIKGTGELYAK